MAAIFGQFPANFRFSGALPMCVVSMRQEVFRPCLGVLCQWGREYFGHVWVFCVNEGGGDWETGKLRPWLHLAYRAADVRPKVWFWNYIFKGQAASSLRPAFWENKEVPCNSHKRENRRRWIEVIPGSVLGRFLFSYFLCVFICDYKTTCNSIIH